jgi:uncharacterized protein DUF3606
LEKTKMPDDLKRRTPEDPDRINLNQKWEIDYWTRELGVSEEKLRQAVAIVGNSAAAVRAYLGTP